MRRWIAMAVVLGAMLMSAPAHAADGCELLTVGYMSGACRYVATGPGVFEVETLSGFRIQASDDRGVTWHILAAQSAAPDAPLSGVAVVASGSLKTTAGELVEVGIGTGAVVVGGAPAVRYLDGHIKAGNS